MSAFRIRLASELLKPSLAQARTAPGSNPGNDVLRASPGRRGSLSEFLGVKTLIEVLTVTVSRYIPRIAFRLLKEQHT